MRDVGFQEFLDISFSLLLVSGKCVLSIGLFWMLY